MNIFLKKKIQFHYITPKIKMIKITEVGVNTVKKQTKLRRKKKIISFRCNACTWRPDGRHAFFISREMPNCKK